VDSQAVLAAVYSCTGDAGAAGPGPDLSDATFGALDLKLHDLDALKVGGGGGQGWGEDA
jgi:hypothetical protein